MKEKCWSYEKSETPSYPILEVTLRGPGCGPELSLEERLSLKVDTGYAGELLLSTERYNKGFQLAELPEEDFGTYRTAGGIVGVRRARAIVDIPEFRISLPVIAETPTSRFDRDLAGRGLLKKFWLVLKGTQAESCLRIAP